MRPLLGAKLGEHTQVLGECPCEVIIGDLATYHKFIVANVANEVIIAVDLLLVQGMNIDLKRRILTYSDRGVPLRVGYDT